MQTSFECLFSNYSSSFKKVISIPLSLNSLCSFSNSFLQSLKQVDLLIFLFSAAFLKLKL